MQVSTNMKISVIMIDGGFRDNLYGAHYFSKQNFPKNEYEVIWVEFYDAVKPEIKNNKKLKIFTLNHSKTATYHSSLCFNKGIIESKGDLLIIPDADQIVRPDFLLNLWKIHQGYEQLVVYVYRYDEIKQGMLKSIDYEELEDKCELKNTINYGGCISVRKKWFLAINGYDQHPIFSSGFHANGLDVYTRFKNYGLAIKWEPSLKLFHPWHPCTLTFAPQVKLQHQLINWRKQNLSYLTFNGIDPHKNIDGSRFPSKILESIPERLKYN